MIAAQVLYSVEAGLLLLAACILVGPMVAERLRIPGLVGLIAVGMLLGPNVLEWLRPGGFVATVGAAGLLYLMFLAGIELDLRTFAENRTAALTFGLLTFAIPFGLSFAVGKVHLDYGWSAAALVGAMWASHTVVAYPEAKAAGLDRNRAVGSAVAATVITDVLALIVLALAASSSAIEDTPGVRASTEEPALPLLLGLLLVGGFCLVVLPRMTRWVFINLFHSRTQRFVWMLAGMSAGAIMGLLGGIEGLVGAFLAGIGMNASVPARGELMERIEFFGNSLLVPAFLVSVGLSIDPSALVEGSTLRLAMIFTLLVVVGKTVPAVIAGLIFGFRRSEIAIMATLTIGQAAATLAIAQVGVSTGLFDQEIMDAAVVTVVATVLITSFGTRVASRYVPAEQAGTLALGDHVIALAPDPTNAEAMAEIVSAIATPDGGLVTPFVVTSIGPDAAGGREADAPADALTAFDGALRRRGHDTHPVRRLSDSVPTAAREFAVEQNASVIVVAVPDGVSPFDLPRDNVVDQVGKEATVACIAVALSAEPWRRIVVFTGRARHTSARCADVGVVTTLAARLARDTGVAVTMAVPDDTDVPDADGMPHATRVNYRPRSGQSLGLIESGDLVIVPPHVLDDAGALGRVRLRRALEDTSVIVAASPGRLRLSASVTRRPLIGAVGQRSS